MTGTLHSLSYVSRGRLPQDPAELALELESIVQAARRHNASMPGAALRALARVVRMRARGCSTA